VTEVKAPNGNATSSPCRLLRVTPASRSQPLGVHGIRGVRLAATGPAKRWRRVSDRSTSASPAGGVDVRAYDGCRTPEGQPIRNDEDLANFLLQDGNVAVVAGTSCSLPGYFRITYAVPEETLALGVSRIRQSLGKLRCPG
jgi:hypothetical protein